MERYPDVYNIPKIEYHITDTAFSKEARHGFKILLAKLLAPAYLPEYKPMKT